MKQIKKKKIDLYILATAVILFGAGYLRIAVFPVTEMNSVTTKMITDSLSSGNAIEDPLPNDSSELNKVLFYFPDAEVEYVNLLLRRVSWQEAVELLRTEE